MTRMHARKAMTMTGAMCVRAVALRERGLR